MPPKAKLLFVDDDRFMRQSFVELISRYHYHVKTAKDGLDALEQLVDYPADIVVTDIVMPNMDGHALLEAIQARYPRVFVVVVTGSSRIEDAVQAIRAGAYDYILKPFVFNAIIAVLDGIISSSRSSRGGRARKARPQKGRRSADMVGQDPAVTDLHERIDQAAKTNAPVLITGEIGTGKNLTAMAVHDRSLRRTGPFVRVDCAALKEIVGNGEMFGFEKDGTAAHTGYLEAAEGGSLFLDDVGELPPSIQTELLNGIETRSFRRVGGEKRLKSTVRIISATHRNLAKQVEDQRFLAGLFSRISVVSLEVPPLRDRASDIPLLAAFFLEKFNEEGKKKVVGIRRDVMEILKRYPWPGNVRELSTVIENAAIFCRGQKIVPADIQAIRTEAAHKTIRLALSSWSLDHAEESLIRGALYDNNGNLRLTAEALGIARGTLYTKMKRYGIEKF